MTLVRIRRYIFRAVIMSVIAAVYFVIMSKFIISAPIPAPPPPEPVCRTTHLSEAFAFCGLAWDDLTERRETANYIHMRNADKGHFVAMHKYDCSDIDYTDVYFLVSIVPKGAQTWDGVKWYMVKCMTDSAPVRGWNIYEVSMTDVNDPYYHVLKGMLLEFEAERGGTCPRHNKKEAKAHARPL